MGEQTVVQTEIVVDGFSFVLALSQDARALQDEIRTAATSMGDFVEFVAAGNREVSILITPSSRVAIITEEVTRDSAASSLVLNDLGNWDLL